MSGRYLNTIGQALDANGNPISGAKLYFYEAGTTTLANTYSDEDLTTANANPVVSDAEGRFGDIWIQDISYRVRYTDASDNIIDDQDPVVNIGMYKLSETGSVSRPIASRLSDIPSIKDFDAKFDGVTDDTAAWQLAANAGGFFIVPEGTTVITSTVTFSKPVTLVGAGRGVSIIKPQTAATGGKVLAFETDDVHVTGITIDGTGLTQTLTANKYAIFAGDAVTKYKNHVYDVELINLSESDGNTGVTNLLVTHGVYVDNVDDVHICGCLVDTISGAAVFVRDSLGLYVNDNSIADCGWYPIHFVGGCDLYTICDNEIDSQIAVGAYWGGAIDLMSQHSPLEVRNGHGIVARNKITGKYSYGAVIRISSIDGVVVKDNIITDCSIGTLGGTDLTYIRVNTRGTGVGAENGPSQLVQIIGNIMQNPPAGSAGIRGIYVSNEFQSARNVFEGLIIRDNMIISTDTTNYFSSGIIIHGQDGGFDTVSVLNNLVVTNIQTGSVVNGSVGFVGNNTGGRIDKLFIGGNHIKDLGTAAASYQVGLSIGAYVDNVFNTAPNIIDNFFYGVRTFTNAGPTLCSLDDQEILNTGSLDYLFGVGLSDTYHRSIGGTTAQRPAAGTNRTTYQTYFDTTLGKPIWFDGTNWVDATGATV